jgi:hypothetical protein
MEIFMFMLGITVVIGGIILIFSDTDGSSGTDGVVITLFGLLFITSAIFIKEINTNEINTEVETVTETEKEEISDSAKNSNIKIALIQNYPEAEIISDENDLQQGIFIYNNETYNFEVEDNVLFIKQDKKLVKYIYLN